MKLYFSEFKANYSKYYFPYQIYLKREDEELNYIYNLGFLASRINKDFFYLARNLRVDLNKFKLTSENRRIKRKTEYIKFEVIPMDQVRYLHSIGKLASDFYKKFKNNITANSIRKTILNKYFTHLFVFMDSTNKHIFGYCIANIDDEIIHYAYPFYEIDYFEKNAGMGMMLKVLEYAHQLNKKYFYLGTIYTKESLYKLQFEGLEYFTGFKWSENLDELKNLIENPSEGHLFEEVEDKIELIQNSGIKI